MPHTPTSDATLIEPKPASDAPAQRFTLDLVIPVFNEEAILATLFERLTRVCDSIPGCEWRVILVNDGSRDTTARLIREQHARDPRFCLLSLSRNFGHQPAITAGLAHASADAAIIMDADLQDPPEVIPDLVRAWREDGAQVVLAVRRSRAETGLRGLLLRGFHLGFRWMTDFPIPAQTGVFGLLGKPALEQMQRLTERNRFFPGLRAWIGFEQRVVEYDRDARLGGEPKQTFSRLFRYAADGVLSFSYKPLRLMIAAGALVSAFGFLVAAYFVIKRLTGVETAFTGFTTLVTLVLFLGGIQLIAIGLIGEYLGRIYDEVKNRPLYIVGETVGIRDPARESAQRPLV
ncbi:MAG: glycosyltransferase family 2 protein [Phycisphaeraceae bacterium]|nr:glycosyltransferase family 2 protein [Phycisphaeraceae bacterium]